MPSQPAATVDGAVRRPRLEGFARASYTRGDSGGRTWNDPRVLTVGGSWRYRKTRGSINMLYAGTRKDVSGAGTGNAITARLQYLF